MDRSSTKSPLSSAAHLNNGGGEENHGEADRRGVGQRGQSIELVLPHFLNVVLEGALPGVKLDDPDAGENLVDELDARVGVLERQPAPSAKREVPR